MSGRDMLMIWRRHFQLSKQTQDFHFRRAHTSQDLFRVCHVAQFRRLWIDAGPSLFLFFSNDDIIQVFGRYEHSRTLPVHSKIAPHSAQIDRQICQKGPWTHGFFYVRTPEESYRSLILLLFIMQTQLMVVGLKMVSVDQLAIFSHQNMSSSKHEIYVSNELSLVNVC